MAVKKEPIKKAESALVISRVFDAPRELVWKAWTDPEFSKRWWGPKDFTAPVSKIDLRVGGKYISCMRSPDGKDIWGTGVYREIVPPERLVMTDSFSDEKGNVLPASAYGMPGDWPLELEIAVTLEEIGDKTKMVLQHIGIPAGKMREDTETGWNESFDKLAESLAKSDLIVTAEPGKQELVLTRIIDAPRAAVFKAQTDPALIPKWWGPRRYETIVDKMDPRPGGIWRFINRDSKGNEYTFKGVFHEVLSPGRLIYTFEFETFPGHVSLETVTFKDLGSKTLVTDHVVYQSVEDRDEMLKAGMLEGAKETMDRFAELVEKPSIKKKAA